MSNKRTPLHQSYRDMPGVKIVDFHGWDLPIHFSEGIIAEHQSVRNAAGLFDVSHMGEFIIEGDDAEAYVDQLVTNSISTMESGEVKYTFLCYPNGTVVDDLIVYKFSPTQFMLVVNAGNVEKDFSWVEKENPIAQSRDTLPAVKNQSDAWALLALQGPKAESVITSILPEAGDIDFFRFRDDLFLDDIPLLVSRTGYTGEDGFEVFLNADDAPEIWKRLLEAGEGEGLKPCGLGARDTLRLEAKLPLYGQEISDSITPLEANLGVFVDFEKPYFVGREALLKQKEQGIPRSLRGLEMIDAGVPRQGYAVYSGEEQVGVITSGTKSPTLKKFIALALIKRGIGLKVGNEVEIDIHGKRKKARLVKTPFYKKSGRS